MNNTIFKRKYNYGDFKDITDIYKTYDSSEMKEQEIFGNRIEILPVDNGEENNAEMLIRLFPTNAITIARIAVNNKGVGIGSKIIEAMIKYCKNNQLCALYVESILSVEMINLVLKYNFKPVEGKTFIFNNNIFGDYKLDIRM